MPGDPGKFDQGDDSTSDHHNDIDIGAARRGVRDAGLATLLLTNRLSRVAAKPLLAREFWSLIDRTDQRSVDVGALLTCDEDMLSSVAADGVTIERLRTLLSATRALAFELERLGEGGVSVIPALDFKFPGLLRDRLGHRCPPSLFTAGPSAWITAEPVAIVGADDADSDAHATARLAAAAVVAAGRPVLTDFDTPIGIAVTDETLACEGALVAVSAAGINRAARQPHVRRLVQRQGLCLVSAFAPDAAQSAATTAARDSIVHGLASITLVVAVADGTSNTWRAAADAVQRDPAATAAWVGLGTQPGGDALIALGARRAACFQDLVDLFALR